MHTKDLGPVWFVANCATLCLRLVIQIEELTLGKKVRQRTKHALKQHSVQRSGIHKVSSCFVIKLLFYRRNL
jgi:hypothetical protein